MEIRLEWKPEYSLGDELIDRQHQYLFQLANEVFSLDKQPELSSAVIQLYQYVRKHFADEEALMEERLYPEREYHRSLHDELLDRLTGLPPAHSTDVTRLRIELYQLLQDWLMVHILQEDCKIAQWEGYQRN